MKTIVTIAASMFTGAMLATAVTGLHAQNTGAGAFAIVDISQVTDANAFKQELLPKVTPESLKPYGGRYLVRTETVTNIDGTPPARFVILGFDSVDKAKEWNASKNQQEVNAIRAKTTKSRSFIVERFAN